MINHNNRKQKIRTVAVNERGQIVIPEDIRKDLGISDSTTLVIIEKEGEIVIKKEEDVLHALSDEAFWKKLSIESLRKTWTKDDEILDNIARKDVDA